MGISETKLNQWVENIRKWISQTILTRVISEIDKVNDSLMKMGSIDFLIGGLLFFQSVCLSYYYYYLLLRFVEASLSTVKQVVALKKEQIPSLELLVPYLELTVHQQYFIKRLKGLIYFNRFISLY